MVSVSAPYLSLPPDEDCSLADFSEADFSEADFSDADFSDADFSDADFSDSDLAELDLSEAADLSDSESLSCRGEQRRRRAGRRSGLRYSDTAAVRKASRGMAHAHCGACLDASIPTVYTYCAYFLILCAYF